jgi:hypothetical protein
LAASRRDRALAPFPVLLPPPDEGGPGALRVEVRGTRGGVRETVVHGVFDRPGVAASALAAVCAVDVVHRVAPGASGLAAHDLSVDLLGELARRGVRVARFHGGSD